MVRAIASEVPAAAKFTSKEFLRFRCGNKISPELAFYGTGHQEVLADLIILEIHFHQLLKPRTKLS
jgi:hypothetical protein